jgi:hypothetical protein
MTPAAVQHEGTKGTKEHEAAPHPNVFLLFSFVFLGALRAFVLKNEHRNDRGAPERRRSRRQYTTPPFMTNATRSKLFKSARASPSSAMMSANLPGASEPTRSSQPMS